MKAPGDSHFGKKHLKPLKRRNFLFLQGLMGPFFERVGEALLADGYKVAKINFNGGDKLFWRLPGGVDYRGSLEDWPDFLRNFIVQREITDVVIFGDCRLHHMAAARVCEKLQVPMHVFEEGYLRPDWVTLELGGVNGHSRLPRDPDYYRVEAQLLPPQLPHSSVPSSFQRRAAEGIAYNTADLLLRWYFPHWTNHRPWHPLVEGMGWLKRFSRRKAVAERTKKVLSRLEACKAPYMLFPLQLDADAQVRLHSGFSGMQEAIEYVISSFTAHAPANMRLIIKQHPLDNGLRDWRHIIACSGRHHGVLRRIGFIEGVTLPCWSSRLKASSQSIVQLVHWRWQKVFRLLRWGRPSTIFPALHTREHSTHFGRPRKSRIWSFSRHSGAFWSNTALLPVAFSQTKRCPSWCGVSWQNLNDIRLNCFRHGRLRKGMNSGME